MITRISKEANLLAFIMAAILTTATFLTCIDTRVTHYGVSYQNQQMGCEGSGTYDTNNIEIIAAGYNSGYSCGDRLVVVGPVGGFIGTVEDSCPGCNTGLDLSEAGIERACGDQADVCYVKVSRLE